MHDNKDAKMEALIAEVLTAYPEKFAKRRKKHLSVAKPVAEAAETEKRADQCDVKSNIKSVPGVMTVRGCAYAGAKGVVWGPVKDMVTSATGRSAAGSIPGRSAGTTTSARPASTPSAPCSSPPTSRSRTSSSAATRGSTRSSRDRQAFPAGPRHHHPVRMPGGADRRRHRSGRQEGGQGDRQDDRAGALRGLPRRVAVAGPPHRQRHDPRLGVRQEGRSSEKPAPTT